MVRADLEKRLSGRGSTLRATAALAVRGSDKRSRRAGRRWTLRQHQNVPSAPLQKKQTPRAFVPHGSPATRISFIVLVIADQTLRRVGRPSQMTVRTAQGNQNERFWNNFSRAANCRVWVRY
jgi:hypothetical protein